MNKNNLSIAQKERDFNHILNENHYLISSIVNKYLWNRMLSKNELTLIAQEGLYKAYLKFDKNKGIKFPIFAYNYIKNEILDVIATIRSNGTMSNSEINNIYKINKIINKYVQNHDVMPTSEQISLLSNGEFTTKKIELLRTSMHFYSLDEKISDDLILSDTISTDSIEIKDDLLENKIEEMLDVLNDEEKEVITYYYLNDISNFAEIARLMNKNSNRIRTIYLRAIKRIKSSDIHSIREDEIIHKTNTGE